ncbi:glycine betaine ABC transporter substrate-binding protein [Halobacteriales archaeon Cl-PHB]
MQVGSKSFIENRLLGHMCLELLKERSGVSPINHINYSNTTSEIWGALVEGELDVYWEYSGTLWHKIPPKRTEQYHDVDEMYRQASRLTEAEYDVEVLAKAPFNNSFGIVTTSAWVAETGVESIGDFAAYLNAGNTDVVAAVVRKTDTRADAWAGMVEAYDIRDEIRREWDEQRNNVLRLPIGETYARLLDGTVDVILGFTSDPQIERHDLVLLRDEENFWSAYSPAPVLRASLAADSTGIRDDFDELGPAIGDIETMRRLGAEVLFDDRYPGDVARSFLESADVL